MDREEFLTRANAELASAEPEEALTWALKQAMTPLATTSMGPESAAFLHLIAEHAPQTPVVWVDGGFNTEETYEFADTVRQELQLDLRIYRPQMSPEEILAHFGGELPGEDDEERLRELSSLIKLQPFDAMQRDMQADLWLTGIRRDETEFRQTLDVVTQDARIPLRVAPLFHKDSAWVADYLSRHQLPAWHYYKDPTKPNEDLECGLHLALTPEQTESRAEALELDEEEKAPPLLSAVGC